MRNLLAFIVSILMFFSITPMDSFAGTSECTVINTKLIATGFAKSGKQVVKWTKVSGADGYEVYFAECGDAFKKVKTVSDRNTFSYTKKGLSNKKTYMFKVKAFNETLGNRMYISISPVIYVSGIRCKYSNATAVEMYLIFDGDDLVIGDTIATETNISAKNSKKNVFTNDFVAKIRYYSADENIVKIDSFGIINAVGEGRCYIYAVAPSGAYSKVKISVVAAVENNDIKQYDFNVPGNRIAYQPVWDDDPDNLNISDITELTYDRSKAPEDFNEDVYASCGVSLSSTDLGISEITITGYGEYNGEVVIPVMIVKHVFDNKKESITSSSLSDQEFSFMADMVASIHTCTFTYTGKPIKPTISNVCLDDEDSYITIQEKDYDVQYIYSEDTVNIGEKQLTAVITFKNRMDGKATVVEKYNIGPENTKLRSVKAGKKSLTVRWKKKTSNTDGYIIVLMDQNSVKHKKYYVNSNKTTKIVLKNLKAKRGYDVFVMTYKVAGGKKIPSSIGYAFDHGIFIRTK